MMEYRARLQRKFKHPVRQFVIYLGAKPSRMQTQLPKVMVIEGYILHSLRNILVERILESDIPEEIMLAILGDYPKPEAIAIIREVMKRLQFLTHDPSRFQRYLQ